MFENGEFKLMPARKTAAMSRSDAAAYRALAARDPRFDGLFFAGVTTTGIYCRPICPARTPKASNCRFFANAMLADHDNPWESD